MSACVTNESAKNSGAGSPHCSERSRLAASTIKGNQVSWSKADGANLLSYGDNYIDGNFDGDPTPFLIPRK